ncbi:uncharacterized protein LOC134841438 isoform X2 [Symsagittifera roscoffensis]|uniref:uncharacterized protein LOC134841438 isoform X2 n=1 Tax=Symsagittifera roscoffensis TaxID=84072 RepID=UPI00307BC174
MVSNYSTLAPAPAVRLENEAACLTENRNYTSLYRQDYGGVHITFALNAGLTILIVLLFSFMRKGIGGYARLGVTMVRSGLPNIMTATANRISEAGQKIRHSRIVSQNVANSSYEVNGGGSEYNEKTSLPRSRLKGNARISVSNLRRSTIIPGVEDGDEFATLPISEVLDMGDIQLDADLIATTNNNNNSFDVIDRNGGSRRIANGDQVDGTSSNGLTITASTSNSSPNSGGKLINIGSDKTELEKRRVRILDEDERNLFSWIKLTLTLNISDFGHKVNQDCVQYLHFQRHVIGFMLLNTIICMLVLLPINVVGGNQFSNNTKSFGRLTLNNLEPDSNLLVVHSIYAFAMCIFILVIMDRFEKKYVHEDPSMQTTVLVKNFPIRRALFESGIKGKPHLLLSRLETYFTRVLKILPSNFQIYLTFDVSDLEKLVKRYYKYTECIDYVMRKNEKARLSKREQQLDAKEQVELNSLPRSKPEESRDIISFDDVMITVENQEVGADAEEVVGANGDEESPSPSEVVEKSYVMDSREFAARQNSSSKHLQPVSNYLSDDITTLGSDVITDADVKIDNHSQPRVHINCDEPSTSKANCTYNGRSSAQSPKIAIKKASMKIRESVHLNNLNLKFNKCCAGFLCPFCSETRNAFEYYTEKREEVVKKIVKLIQTRPFEQRTLPMFFLTLPSKKVADTICNFLPYEQTLHTHQWEVTMAPNVDDVIWENLSLSTVSKRVRWCIAQVLFVVLFFFISTPSIVIGFTNYLNEHTKWKDYLEKVPLMKVFVGPLIFVILAALLPFLVILISDVRGFSTKSRLNFYNYRRVYIFLFFMILVLPSIGLTNIVDLIREFFEGVNNLNYTCIFRPDNSAFFVNYIISAAMLGLMAELLRIADMLFYLILLILMKSKAERKYVKKQSILQFPYGYCYAFQLLAVCVVIVYSPICPIIAPFGLIYSLMRHYVDRYNLYFSFEPSKLNQNIHKSSTVILLSAGFLSLVLLFIYSLIKSDTDKKLKNLNSIILLILIILVVCYWTIKKFLYMVNSVSKGVIETSNLIKQASEENILAAGQGGSNAQAVPKYSATANNSTNQSLNNIAEDCTGNYQRTESEPIIDVVSRNDTAMSNNGSFLNTPMNKKAATFDTAEHDAERTFLNTPISLKKKPKKISKPSDFQLDPISELEKYLPPIYHLLKSPDVASKLKVSLRPKGKSWFSQGPDKSLTGSMKTGRKFEPVRSHRRSASDGGKLDASGKEKSSSKSKARKSKDELFGSQKRDTDNHAATSGSNNIIGDANNAEPQAITVDFAV